MLTLLDMIENHDANRFGNNGPTVTRENHDPNAINWVAGMSDPGEMIGCGMYQELRRFDNENDETYAKRLRFLLDKMPADVREKIEAAGSAAANRRANFATVNGKQAYLGVDGVDWHTLGTNVSKAFTFAEAMALAPHMNLTVKKIRNTYTHNGTTHKSRSYELVREDTGGSFYTVGEDYAVIQPADAFSFVDGCLAKFGAKFESLGHTDNGRKMFLTVQFPREAFAVNGNSDVIQPYGVFTNQHGGAAALFFGCSFRAVCENTARLAAAQYRAKGYAIHHQGNIKSKIAAAQNALGIMVENFGEHKQQLTAMTAAKVEPIPFFNGILDDMLEISAEQAKLGADTLARMTAKTDAEREIRRKAIARQIKERSNIIGQMLDTYHSSTNGTNGMRGTVYSAYESAVEYADHHKAKRKIGTTEDQAARLFESVLVGARDDMKQVALQHALQAI